MTSKEHITALIGDYPKLRKDLDFLKYELASYKELSADDAIKTLQFSRSDNPIVDSSNISDKTCRIALRFREYMARMEEGGYREILLECKALEYTLRWLDCQVAKIREDRIRLAVEDHLSGVSKSEILRKHQIQERTYWRYRRRAADIVTRAFDEEKPILARICQ